MHYIRQNISKSLTLDDIAMNVGVNKYHMCKVFKASTGSTINHYIIACRISRAKDLLQEGRSVTDACYDSGFHNLSHFIRTFHTNVGITPGKYVQEKEEEKARLMSIHFHTP